VSELGNERFAFADRSFFRASSVASARLAAAVNMLTAEARFSELGD